MAVVIGSNLRKEIAGSLLFEGVSFSVERGDRLSLSGPNGAGKTTLLRMLAGETEVHGGELVFAKGTRIALHDQRPPLQHGLTLREYALSGARDLVETEEELRSLEQAMAGGEHGAATLRRYSEAQARLEHAGGYDWRERAARVLRGLGFVDADLDRPLETFSGGELTRASLARALAGDPDLLLLDEPTNHLDVENLEWLELELLTRGSRSLGFDFLKPARSGRTVVEGNGLEIAAGEKELLADASFALERGEHVGLVGPNGSGKTTLLETVLGRREPKAGSVRLGYGVEDAYFSQHEVELDERGSVLDCAQRATGLPRPQAQKLLGRFLFSGWEAHEKAVTVLSGGERRRLALALTVASGANFLVLDEPTNHLDLESREALEGALDAFPGTILLVSHDRALLDAVAHRLLAIEDGALRSFEGGWAEYVRAREARTAPPPPPPEPPKKQKASKPVAARPSELDRVEAEIAAREEAVSE